MRKELIEGINALARAARRGKGHSLLRGDTAALAEDEVLIAVAGTKSVAVRRVKVPPSRIGSRPPSDEAALEAVARRLAEIDLVASEIAEPLSALAAPPAMSEAEERLLLDAGLDPGPLGAEGADPVHRATAEYARLLHDSYTVEEAAAALGVNPSRIRQRLAGSPRTLYGIKIGGAWRIPKFQFQGRGLVPGIDRVVRRLPEDLHPVTVYRWFTTPSPDLEVEDDTLRSPLDWLRVGNRPEAVAELASQL